MSKTPDGQLSLPLISSSGASPARISQSPEAAPASRARARASRMSSSAWSTSCNPVSSSSRTSIRDGSGGCPSCGAASTPEGMPACRFDCQPLKLEHPIAVFDVSLLGGELLPPPTAARYGSGQNGDPGDGRGSFAQKGKPSLHTMAARGLLPTPTAGDAKASGSRSLPTNAAHTGYSLTDAVVRRTAPVSALLPTPAAQDHKNNTFPPSQRTMDTLPGEVMRRMDPESGSRLHPEFVEWMMGFPRGWTDPD